MRIEIWICDTGREIRVFDTEAAAFQWARANAAPVGTRIWNMMARK